MVLASTLKQHEEEEQRRTGHTYTGREDQLLQLRTVTSLTENWTLHAHNNLGFYTLQ